MALTIPLLSLDEVCMQGVVSILDTEHSDIIERLWSDLEREFGLVEACRAYPHVSYQVVEQYDPPRVKGVLRRFARAASPFHIRTSGLGVFLGDMPTLYVTVARSEQLSSFHARLWKRLSRTATGIHEHHYGPDNFIPHITLAAGDLTKQQIPDVIRYLSQRAYNWEISIDNLALVLDVNAGREQWQRYSLSTAE